MSENNIHELLNRIENSLDSLNDNPNISTLFSESDVSTDIPNLLRTSLNNFRNNRLPASGRTTIRIPIGVVRTPINSEETDESNGISEEEFEYLYDYNISRDTEDNCSICMENFKENNCVIKLDCGHIFHKSCLNTWLHNHKTCPVCRYDVASKFEEYKELINKLAMYQSIINIIPTILLHNPPNEDEESDENSGLFGWFKWGVKKLGSYIINS